MVLSYSVTVQLVVPVHVSLVPTTRGHILIDVSESTETDFATPKASTQLLPDFVQVKVPEDAPLATHTILLTLLKLLPLAVSVASKGLAVAVMFVGVSPVKDSVAVGGVGL